MITDEFDFIIKLRTDMGKTNFHIYVKSSFERYSGVVTVDSVKMYLEGCREEHDVYHILELFDRYTIDYINTEAQIRAIHRAKETKRELENE